MMLFTLDTIYILTTAKKGALSYISSYNATGRD